MSGETGLSRSAGPSNAGEAAARDAAILESAYCERDVAVSDRERLRGLSQSLSQFRFSSSATGP